MEVSGGLGFIGLTLRLHSSSFLGFIYRILEGNPKKELLWSLWVGSGFRVHRVYRFMVYRASGFWGLRFRD